VNVQQIKCATNEWQDQVFPAIDVIVVSVTVWSIDNRTERHHIALFPQTAAPHGISPNGTHEQPDMVTWSTASVPDAIGTRSYLPTPHLILLHNTYCTPPPLPRSSALLLADGVVGLPTARLLCCHCHLHSCVPTVSQATWCSSMLQWGGLESTLCSLSQSSQPVLLVVMR
jgi:hypothetical protein